MRPFISGTISAYIFQNNLIISQCRDFFLFFSVLSKNPTKKPNFRLSVPKTLSIPPQNLFNTFSTKNQSFPHKQQRLKQFGGQLKPCEYSAHKPFLIKKFTNNFSLSKKQKSGCSKEQPLGFYFANSALLSTLRKKYPPAPAVSQECKP